MARNPRTKNAAALRALERWYATPDRQPPGYWNELAAEVEPCASATLANLAQMLEGSLGLARGQGDAVLVPRAHLARWLALVGEAAVQLDPPPQALRGLTLWLGALVCAGLGWLARGWVW